MSAIEFFMNGGAAMVDGDLPENERKLCNEFLKKYGDKIKVLGKQYLIPASQLLIFRLNFLFITRDQFSYHFAFVEKPGSDTIVYRDMSSFGVIPPQTLIHQIKIEVGEVTWLVTVPIANIDTITDDKIAALAKNYIEATLEAEKSKKDNKISDEAISTPEIGKFIELFRKDYPIKTKTAFIIMQFSKSKLHDEIVKTIKEVLFKYNIIGLRADDKEYSDDLLQNISTYMHCADFGIAVFERIYNDDFNPNVSFEVGYMLGLKKNVCLLKDQTLTELHSDLVGKLYKQFDTHDIPNTLPDNLEKWLKDKGII